MGHGLDKRVCFISPAMIKSYKLLIILSLSQQFAMSDSPRSCACMPAAAQCPTNHHQLSPEMAAASYASAKAIIDPIIMANTDPSAKYLVPMIQSTICQLCPPVNWKIIWTLSYETNAAGEKVVKADMLSAEVIAAAHTLSG